MFSTQAEQAEMVTENRKWGNISVTGWCMAIKFWENSVKSRSRKLSHFSVVSHCNQTLAKFKIHNNKTCEHEMYNDLVWPRPLHEVLRIKISLY